MEEEGVRRTTSLPLGLWRLSGKSGRKVCVRFEDSLKSFGLKEVPEINVGVLEGSGMCGYKGPGVRTSDGVRKMSPP